MQFNDALYKAFLDRMQDLENFRMTYAARFPQVALDRDDPDVKRLTEAVAFFAARTHQTSLHHLVMTHLRLFQQYFPYMLTPLPAMAMLNARITGQFAETVNLPKGTIFSLAADSGETAMFLTLREMRILPLMLSEIKFLLLPNKGFRLVLMLNTPYPRNDDIGRIGFYINHLNNYKASLQVLFQLRQHLSSASVVFEEDVNENTKGIRCEASFGVPDDEKDDFLNPLQEERQFFHFPQQDLCINFQIPSPPRNWSRFAICLDLDQNWSRNLILNRDIFQLFTVPIMNLIKTTAKPFICDGTRSRFPILHPSPDKEFELHSADGVYMIDDNGTIPLRPGILSGGHGSYEIEEKIDEKLRSHKWLILYMPESFNNPVTISIDGFWFQPSFSELVSRKLRLIPYSRNIPGLEWEIIGGIVPHERNRFGDNMENFMNIFVLKNKNELNPYEVNNLISAMGSIRKGEFRETATLLSDIRITKAPPKRESSDMMRLIYHLTFKEPDSGIVPMAETFAVHIGRILNAWISGAEIEVRTEFQKAA